MAPQTPNTPRELEEGRLFEDRYRIVEEIGSGGFGRVYLAHQEEMDRRVALKVLKSEWEGDQAETIKNRFLREVRVISKLRHPNTVTIHDFGESDAGTFYMVLEYIEGEPLDEILDREGAQPPSRALAITKQVTESLAEAHRHGVVHRDLKPANIMLTNLGTEEDFVKVLDFGVAHVLQSDQPDLTKGGVDEGEMLGTPRYMSPEQVRGDKVDGRADIYCLGLLLYELLVGRPAVTGNTTMALITQQISPDALELDGLQRLPAPVRTIVETCTDKEIDHRYESTEELVEDLEEAKRIVEQESSAEMALQNDFADPDRSSLPSDGVVGADDPPELDRGWQTEEYEGGTPEMTDEYDTGTPELTEEYNPDEHADEFEPAERSSGGGGPSGPASAPGDTAGSDDGIDLDSRVGDGDSPDLASDPSRPVEEPQQQQPDSSQSHEEVDEDLPPPPDDSVVEATDELRPGPGAGGRPVGGGPGESRNRTGRGDSRPPSYSALDVAKVVFFGILAIVSVYGAFLVIGALLGTFLEGTTRIAGALSLALAIPVLTALGETSERERFRVVRRRIDKIMRACMGTAIFAFGSAVLVALAVPRTTVDQLRLHPNWFLTGGEPPQVRSINRKFSHGLGEVVATTTGALGLYDDTSGDRLDDEESAPPSEPESDEPSEGETAPDGSETDEQEADGAGEEPSSDDSADDEPRATDEASSDDEDPARSATELLQQESESEGSQKKGAAGTESDESDRTPSGDDSEYQDW